MVRVLRVLMSMVSDTLFLFVLKFFWNVHFFRSGYLSFVYFFYYSEEEFSTVVVFCIM